MLWFTGQSGWHRFRNSSYFISSTYANWTVAQVCMFICNISWVPAHFCYRIVFDIPPEQQHVMSFDKLIRIIPSIDFCLTFHRKLFWLIFKFVDFLKDLVIGTLIRMPCTQCKRKRKGLDSVEWLTSRYVAKYREMQLHTYIEKCVLYTSVPDWPRTVIGSDIKEKMKRVFLIYTFHF